MMVKLSEMVLKKDCLARKPVQVFLSGTGAFLEIKTNAGKWQLILMSAVILIFTQDKRQVTSE